MTEDYIKDKDCTIDTPVVYGKIQDQIYGKGICISPRIDGRKDTKHFEEIYLEKLYPLEDYDLIVVLISGGKDSIACLLKLLEMGVPTEKIELWHHDIDGGNPTRRMDWKCTQNYMRALAKAFNVPLRLSWRKGGFFEELYRIGASEAIYYQCPQTGEIKMCKPSSSYLKSEAIKRELEAEHGELIKEYAQRVQLNLPELEALGKRLKFPAKSPDLSRRWCSAYLKIAIADSVMSNLDQLGELEKIGKRLKFPAKSGTHQGRWCSGNLKAAVQDSVTVNIEQTARGKKILVVSGERRGESSGRSHYNEMELGRTCAEKKMHRTVHTWRPVIDWSEADVWEIMRRHRINPHPCYRIGWNRCSCSACIFSTPGLMKAYSEVYEKEYAQLVEDEHILGFTIDNKKPLPQYIEGAESRLNTSDKKALHSILTGEFDDSDIFVENWTFPCGAFHGSDGGSC